ncbi:Tim44 domain-containing protein [Pararoseomonas indoligenes]|uniref:TIM44-like domain-containing protein n=1 Tax=Roseomonas indoligenes TaxID=2820811 RepID=A0A940S7M9_9PROT|nr:TIM44-like domain-containing protein [Pararoseomonas indoligenes]MBP0495224.1 TIM44-like domain-containing protein [Pararoseomonas indoligenes]
MRPRPRPRARLLAAFAALALALGPAIAEARPGGGFSSGSRGSRSYAPPPSTRTAPGTANPFNRTETPRPGYNAPSPGYAQPRPTPSYTNPNRGGMFGGGFMSGLMGGLLGAGIAGMLFGHGAFGGMSGGAGFLGFLLQLALIAGIIWFVLRALRNRSPAPAMAGATPNGAMARSLDDGNAMGRGAGGRTATRALQITETDFAAFENTLIRINQAWSNRDTGTLARLATPEMVRYFEGDLRDLSARGWHNETRDVRLESGDLSEAWAEDGLEYATVAMRFSMIDVTRDTAGQVVEGDPNTRQTSTEIWTFVRRPRETWLLSAIQQVG